MGIVALSLGVSVTIGVADFLGGVTSQRLPPVLVIAASQSIGFVPLCLALLLAGGAPDSAAFIPWALGAAVCGAVCLIAFYEALALGPMGVVAPLATLSVVVPVAVGLGGGEEPGALVLFGLAVAVIGTVVTAAATGTEPGDGPAAPRGRRGIGLALIAAAAGGVWVLCMHEATTLADPLWATWAFRAAEIALLLSVLAIRRIDPRPAAAHLPALVAIGLLEAASTVAYATALSEGLIVVVAVLASLFPVVTALLARMMLHERLTAWQRAGAVAVLAGVVLVAAAAP